MLLILVAPFVVTYLLKIIYFVCVFIIPFYVSSCKLTFYPRIRFYFYAGCKNGAFPVGTLRFLCISYASFTETIAPLSSRVT